VSGPKQRDGAAHDPELQEQLDTLLKTCIQCGLCLPHCATYLATGSEVQSPRGRLLLLGEALRDPDVGRDRAVLAAWDLCLGCRACETACPSGVSFTLLEHAQSLAAAGGAVAVPPGAGRLDRRPALRLLRHAGRAACALLRLLLGRAWRCKLEGQPLGLGRLGRLLGTLPTAPAADAALAHLIEQRFDPSRRITGTGRQARDPDIVPAANGPAVRSVDRTAASEMEPAARGVRARSERRRVVFFRGCASDALLPDTARRLRELLAAGGCDVDVPAGQECCGALAAHSHRTDRARALRSRNTAALAAAAGAADAVVVEAAGCGLELRGYPEPIASKVRDAVELLAELELPSLAALPLRVAVHDPCHARHGQGIVAAPRLLLSRIPQLVICEPHEAEVCCGSGGPYALRHPELAEAMGRRKAVQLAATGADLVVTSNPGCLGQIADGLAIEAPELPVVPLSDLLWYAWKRQIIN
jgi:glycolate oxidase iron-sulfur subunit